MSGSLNDLSGQQPRPNFTFSDLDLSSTSTPSVASEQGVYSQATNSSNVGTKANQFLGDPNKGDDVMPNPSLMSLLMPENPSVARLPNQLAPTSVMVSQPGLNTSTGVEGASMQQIKNRFNQEDRYTYDLKFAKGAGDSAKTRQPALNNFLNRFTEGTQNEYIY